MVVVVSGSNTLVHGGANAHDDITVVRVAQWIKAPAGYVFVGSDGRFSGGSHGFVAGHITPEAFDGGPIGLLEEGDEITIDAVNNRIDMKVSDEDLAARKAKWVQPEPRYRRGVLAKFAKLTSTASEGAVTDGSL